MKLSTLCYCLRDNQVLLGMKKRGFGEGKWNGYGGKVNKEETPREAAIRELHEESGLIVSDRALEEVALVNFYFEEEQFFECHVFLVKNCQGEPCETDEMKPQWFPVLQLPIEEMWAGDDKWVPSILTGERLEVEVNFNADGSKVKSFSCRKKQFS